MTLIAGDLSSVPNPDIEKAFVYKTTRALEIAKRREVKRRSEKGWMYQTVSDEGLINGTAPDDRRPDRAKGERETTALKRGGDKLACTL